MSSDKIHSFWLWIFAALVLRLGLMAVTAHSDVVFLNYFPAKLAYEGVWNIYGYINANFPDDRLWSYYPPFTYFTIGAFQWLLKPLAGGFNVWIAQAYSMGLDKCLLQAGVSFEVFKYLIMMKTPYLFFDGICLGAALGLSGGEVTRSKAIAMWALNPVVLYGVYMFGQADIMPASLAALGVLCIMRKKNTAGFALLGSAVLFKTYALFMVPPLVMLVSRTAKDAVKNMAAVILIPVIVLWPFFRDGVMGSLFPKFYVGTLDNPEWFLARKVVFGVLYFSLLYGAFRKRKEAGAQENAILGVSISAVLLLYVLFFTPVHYFVWVMPLMAAAVLRGMIPGRVLWGSIVLLFIYNLNSPRTTTELLAPLDPGYFLSLPGFPDMMHAVHIPWGTVMLGSEMAFLVLCVVLAAALGSNAPQLGKMLGIKNEG